MQVKHFFAYISATAWSAVNLQDELALMHHAGWLTGLACKLLKVHMNKMCLTIARYK